MMEWYWAVAALFGSIMFLMLVGIPVGLAFLVCNVGAAIYWFGGTGTAWEQVGKGVGLLVQNGFQVVASPNLVPSTSAISIAEPPAYRARTRALVVSTIGTCAAAVARNGSTQSAAATMTTTSFRTFP